MDVTVLRQVGVPEAIITLAERDRVVDSARSERTHSWRGFPDLSFLDELEEDPDARPYTWDLPEGCE